MEIGLAHEDKGITYFELVYAIHGTKEKVFTTEAEYTFFNWFIENFDGVEGVAWLGNVNLSALFHKFLTYNEKANTYHVRRTNSKMFDYLNVPFFLRGHAAKQYLDYVELQESRKTAMEAKKQSNVSIWLAVGAIVISTILGWASLNSTQNVKVIEDTTKTQLIEKENQHLKDELYKAEMMLKVYESKTKS